MLNAKHQTTSGTDMSGLDGIQVLKRDLFIQENNTFGTLGHATFRWDSSFKKGLIYIGKQYIWDARPCYVQRGFWYSCIRL